MIVMIECKAKIPDHIIPCFSLVLEKIEFSHLSSLCLLTIIGPFGSHEDVRP